MLARAWIKGVGTDEWEWRALSGRVGGGVGVRGFSLLAGWRVWDGRSVVVIVVVIVVIAVDIVHLRAPSDRTCGSRCCGSRFFVTI